MFRNLFKRVSGFVAVALVAMPMTVGAQAFSDYAENLLIDRILRGQAATFPTTLYVGLSTTACSDASVGTEVIGGNYARASVAAALTNFSGTQGAGTTVASNATSGISSNNNVINFPTPSASWGTVTHWFISDAASGGNLWFCAALTQSKVINSGDTVSFAAGALSITVQ